MGPCATSRAWAAVNASAGQVVKLSGTAQDVTEAQLVAQEREAYAARLEQSNRELQEFAYVASHDLQEPLRKIRAFADLLLAEYGASPGRGAAPLLSGCRTRRRA